jgi:hypothetical protein
MYNLSRNSSRARIAIGHNGGSRAAELIRLGRARRLGIGRAGIGNGGFTCPTSSGIPQNCAPPAQVCPENQRRYIMPFNPDTGFTKTVAAGATTRFVGDPQALFSPDRLIIASTIAPYFDITDLSIGNVPQSLSTGAVAADIYSEVATDMEFNFKQAYPGLKITITARNKSSITQTFQAQLAGFAVAQG